MSVAAACTRGDAPSSDRLLYIHTWCHPHLYNSTFLGCVCSVPFSCGVCSGENTAPNDIAYKRRHKLLCKLCRTFPPPAMGARFTGFWLLLTKVGDVETNPGSTTLTINKRVWICDIYHKQIHVRKQISIRCNRIEYWVHYVQSIQTHTSHRHNTTPPLPTLLQSPYPIPTTTTKTQTHVKHSPCPHRIGKSQPNSLIH